MHGYLCKASETPSCVALVGMTAEADGSDGGAQRYRCKTSEALRLVGTDSDAGDGTVAAAADARFRLFPAMSCDKMQPVKSHAALLLALRHFPQRWV
jgi:hypothetical protein